MRIIAFGDIHMNTGAFESIENIRSADYIVITGDLTNFGSRKDAEKMIQQVQAANRNILAVAGNLDQPEVAGYLEETGISLHGRGELIANLGLVGLGGSNYTPFNTPFEFSEQELSGLLTEGLAQVEKTAEHILVSHTPPFHTKVDRLLNGNHVGSTAVRSYIEKHQPRLCLTGHIHEARGEDYIGRTHILNPGMVKDGGYIEVLIEKGKISASLHS
ncbi:MAG: metallophosphoesterase family protein [Deltaproteobacteria bacterium]|jgi:Icc-related predicted phosphoesterase|nr:metallophosphoesterase family protein [Deltaproteobacteria bacterium]